MSAIPRPFALFGGGGFGGNSGTLTGAAPFLELLGTGTGGRSWYVQTGNTASGLAGNLRIFDNTSGVAGLTVAKQTGNALFGSLAVDGVGVIQLPASTALAGGITLGVDLTLFRTAGGQLGLAHVGGTLPTFTLYEGSTATGTLNTSAGVLSLNTLTAKSLQLQTNSTTALTLDTLQNAVFAGNIQTAHSVLTYAASTAVDFTGLGLRTLSLTGDVTLTTSNLAAGRSVTIRIICDGSNRNFTFPGGWTFVGGAAPTSIAASKSAILNLSSFSTTDANVIAAYAVQS